MHGSPRARFGALASTIALAAVLMAARSSELLAQTGFLVIVNHANPVTSLTASELSRVFLHTQATWPSGARAQPVDQGELSNVRRRFSDDVHRMDVPSVQEYWQEVVFSGRGAPPPQRASDDEVIAYVRTHPNAVGYVAVTAVTNDVKVVLLAR
ncbi:MAG: hypothetical protein ABJF01_15790 [bacterium]